MRRRVVDDTARAGRAEPIASDARGGPRAAGRDQDAAHLAAALGVHRKTLFNHCRRARFLPPAELVAWARLAMVAYMLETTGCTIERIGIELGYASDTALRNTIKRYTGQRAGQIRDAGAVEQVIRALEERSRRPARPPALRLV